MKSFFRIVAVCGLLLAGMAPAKAALFVINIDDLTDGVPGVSVTRNGQPFNVVLLPDSTDEFVHFTLPFSGSTNFGGISLSSTLTEPLDGTFSDRLLETATDHIDIKFASDPQLVGLGNVFNFTSVETGQFQQVLNHSFFYPGGNDQYIYNVRSDVNETGENAVPEPASMTLMGLGALSLVGYGWRRRKAVRV